MYTLFWNICILCFETYVYFVPANSAPVHWSHMTPKTSPPHWWRRRRWRGGWRSRWSQWRRTGGWATCWWRWPLSSSLADTQMSPSASCLRLLRSSSQFFNTKQYFVKSFTRQPEFTISILSLLKVAVTLIHWKPLWVTRGVNLVHLSHCKVTLIKST